MKFKYWKVCYMVFGKHVGGHTEQSNILRDTEAYKNFYKDDNVIWSKMEEMKYVEESDDGGWSFTDKFVEEIINGSEK